MSKTINFDEVDSWDKEELLNNIKYLEDRGHYQEAAPLREKAGLPEVQAEGAPDINLELEQERQVTSRFGTNDTPEYDPGADQTVTIPGGSQKAGRTRDPEGPVGPHGANADQTVPDDDERNTKNRSKGKTKTNSRSSNVGGGGKKSQKGDDNG